MIDFAFIIRWKPRAVKDLERLSQSDRRRVVEAVERYSRTSEGDVQKLSDVHPPEHRLRVGAYRVRFNLDKPGRIMTILRVLPRDKAYRVREIPDAFGTAEATATTVSFGDDEMRVGLSDARTVSVPLAWFPRLLEANPDQRANWELIGGGEGVHWPDIDEDLSVRGFLRGARAPGAKA